MFGRDRRYRRRVAWTLGDYYQQDEWFLDEAERRIELPRGLGRLEAPARFAAAQGAAGSALDAARDMHRRSGADATAILDRSVDAFEALDALQAAVAGAWTEEERDYARELVALLERARGVGGRRRAGRRGEQAGDEEGAHGATAGGGRGGPPTHRGRARPDVRLTTRRTGRPRGVPLS